MGRPITNNSPRAIQKREQMRRVREATKVQSVKFNPRPLMRAIKEWKREANPV